MPGPVPKRSSQRRRKNKQEGPPPKSGRGSGRDEWAKYAKAIGIDIDPAASRSDIMDSVAKGGATDGLHPLAREWFQSLSASGQSAFYEPSDWAMARVIAEAISREFKPQPIVVGTGEHASVEMHEMPPRGASLSAWLKAAGSLLVTEGDRRRLRIELEAKEPAQQDEAVAILDDYRRRPSSSST